MARLAIRLPGLYPLRAQRLLTQEQVATLAAVHRITVIQAEAGRAVRFSTACALATGLGVSLEELRGELVSPRHRVERRSLQWAHNLLSRMVPRRVGRAHDRA
ncbi:MAG: helix-turn-helix transcriptional regulator [Chloroflexota bacterium]